MKLRQLFRATEKKQPRDLRLRECRQWSYDLDEYQHVRYDFAYVDPCNGKTWQYSVDVMVKDGEPIDEERVVEPARARLAQILRRKCGLDRAYENQIQLQLPRTVPGRYV